MKDADSVDKPIPNQRLKRERELRGWSQKDVATRIGGDPKSVSRWELGEVVPGPHFRQKLCEIFEKNIEELGLIKEDVRPVLPSSSPHPSLAEAPIDKPQPSPTDGNPPTSHPTPQEAPWKVASSPHDKVQPPQRGVLRPWRILVIALGALVVAMSLSTYLYIAATKHIVPGGAWISPVNGQTVGKIVHFAAYAYPTNPGDPAIKHVNFTAWWRGVDPRTWKIVCTATPPASNDIFACDTDMSLLGAVPGPIRISFDVYDQRGDVNLAPNGERTIIYKP